MKAWKWIAIISLICVFFLGARLANLEKAHTQELRQVRYNSHMEGFYNGSELGYERGYDAGKAWVFYTYDGELAWDEGYEEGYNKGHDVGYQDGYDSGYENGYSDGYHEAENDCRKWNAQIAEDNYYQGYEDGYYDGSHGIPSQE